MNRNIVLLVTSYIILFYLKLDKLDRISLYYFIKYNKLNLTELKKIAKNKGLKGYSSLKKGDLISKLEKQE